MAGTRLIIQATIVIQIAVLASIAAWYGLCNNRDVFCRPYIDQEARATLEQIRVQEIDNLPVFPIKVLVPEIDYDCWFKAWNGYPGNSFEAVVDENTRIRVCENTSLSSFEFGFYICYSQKEVYHDLPSSTVVFANSNVHCAKLVEILIPTRRVKHNLRRKLIFTLQIEDSSTSDWSAWTRAVEQWMTAEHVMDLPFWRNSVTINNIFGGTLSDQAKVLPFADETFTHYVPQEVMAQSFQYDPSVLEILLYVSTRASLAAGIPNRDADIPFGNGRSYGDSKIVIFPERRPMAKNETDYFLVAHNTLVVTFLDFVQSFILGQDVHFKDHLIPRWVCDLYVQRVLRETYKAVIAKAITLQSNILDSGYDVSVTVDIVEKFVSALQKSDNAVGLLYANVDTRNRDAGLEALALLEEALDILTEVEQDPTLVPPLAFPMDQKVAVFAPLLFPLLIPMILALRREYKRFTSHGIKYKIH